MIFTIEGNILYKGVEQLIRDSWKTKKIEFVIKQKDDIPILIVAEDHKRGHYLATKFQQSKYKIGDPIKVDVDLVGFEYKGKVINQYLLQKIY